MVVRWFPWEHSVIVSASGGSQLSHLLGGCAVLIIVGGSEVGMVLSGSLAVVPTVCSAVARTSGFAPCLLRGVTVLQPPSYTVAAWVDHTSLFRFLLSHSEEKLLLFSFFHHPKNPSSASVVRLTSWNLDRSSVQQNRISEIDYCKIGLSSKHGDVKDNILGHFYIWN